MAVDIIKELEAKRPEIDEVIKKYLPRKYSKESLEFTLGKPEYEYDVEALSRTINKPMWDFLDRGGKRWRPALFLLVVEALGGDPDKVKDFVLIPEIVHNGTLIIDDIEDGSDLRRGLPCAHKTLGTDVAINLGNTMYYLPLLPLIKNKHKFGAEAITKVYETYAQEMINISHGQAMDLWWHKRTKNSEKVTEQQYLQMCAYKTGTLARMSVKIAAILAGADDEKTEKLGKFAETIGVAFQIQDDVLNLTAKSGKSQFVEEYIGSDITEGKRTLMVIHALQKADAKDKKRLNQILDEHTKDKEKINEAINIISKCGGVNYAKKRAKDLMEGSWKEIDAALKPSEGKEKLHAFAKYLIERDV